MNKDNSFQDQLKQARRRQIIDAAIAVVADQGFQKTTIKQIATEAGVADGTIYNYFKNKDDILMGIIERLSEAESREMSFAQAEHVDFQTFMSTFVSHRMAEMNSNFQTFKVILPETIIDAELSRRVYDQVYAPMFGIAEDYFDQLMARDEVEGQDPALLSRLFAAPLLGLIMLRLLGDEHVAANWEVYTPAVIEFLMNAVKKS